MRKFVIIVFLILSWLCIYAQLKYTPVGTYKGETAQGMAIWKDTAYLFSNGGACRVYDLKTSTVQREFLLSTADKYNHTNAATFGLEVGDNGIPVLYITEGGRKTRCFVEDISTSRPVLLQTIEAYRNNKSFATHVWTVDRDNGWLYGISRKGSNKATISTPHTITRYRLPKLSEGRNIVLSEKDILDEFIISFVNLLQGAKVIQNKMFIVTGLQESLRNRPDSQRALFVIDTKKHSLKEVRDLTYVTTNEPEDLDFYKGKILMYTGQEGGLYELKK